MNQFTDNLDRTWEVEITWGTVKRLKSEGIDLLSLLEKNSQLMKSLLDDEEAVGNLISLVLTPQIKERGIDEYEFAEGFIGETIDKALTAIIHGVANFSRPRKGEVIRKTWETINQAEEKLCQRMIQKIQQDLPEQAMNELEKHLEQSKD